MSITYPFTKVGFFFKGDDNHIGNLAGEGTPEPNDGSIFFENPLSAVQTAVCVSYDKEENTGYVATFPHINKFPEDEFNISVKGKYTLPDDAPPNTIPYMVLRGACGKCVCIQVLIKSED